MRAGVCAEQAGCGGMHTASTFARSGDLVFAAQDAGRIFGFGVGAGVCFGFLMAFGLGCLPVRRRPCPFASSLASAQCRRASRVAPVRGGTYFSLPPQRKVGKRKRLTPPALVFACGPPTAPSFTRQRTCSRALPTLSPYASPASHSRVAARRARYSAAAQVANGV